MDEAANALRAVTRPHASAVERHTWREWRQSNPMSAAGLASLAGLAVGGTGLAAVFLARALRNARLAKQRKTTEELVDMHMKAGPQTALRAEIEDICVSRVHDLRDAPNWRDTTTERTQGACEILRRILVKKEARRPDALRSRALDAQIEFLETTIAEVDSAITHAVLSGVDDDSLSGPIRKVAHSVSHRPARRQLAPSPQRLDGAPVPSAKPPSVAVPRENAGHAVVYGAEWHTSARLRHAAYQPSAGASPMRIRSGALREVTSTLQGDGVHRLYGHIATWDVRRVDDMHGAFESTQIAAEDLADLSFWDTRQVKNMRSMFHGAVDFNGDISGWNTSNVEDMAYMFSGAMSFNRDISDWNVKGGQFREGRLNDTFRETGMRHDLKVKIGKRWGLSAAQMSDSWLHSGEHNLASGYGRARRVARGYV